MQCLLVLCESVTGFDKYLLISGFVKVGSFWIEYCQGIDAFSFPVLLDCRGYDIMVGWQMGAFWGNKTWQLLTLTYTTEICLIFCRGGKYTEDDAKTVLIQILRIVSFCHLQGVVHRDLKPEVGSILKLTLINDCRALDLNLIVEH